MSYSSSMLRHTVTILVPEKVDGTTGKKTQWSVGSTIHAAVDWSRGTRALREGDVTVFDIIMVRCRYTSEMNDRCRLQYGDKYFVIDSFHADYMNNTIQITASEVSAGFSIAE